MARITRRKLKIKKTKTKIVIAVKTKFWFITIRKYFDTISKCFPSVLETNALGACFIMSQKLIRSALETRKIRIHTKSKAKKIEMRQNTVVKPRENRYRGRYRETHAFTSGISSELSRLLLSPPPNVPKFVSKHYSFSLSKK